MHHLQWSVIRVAQHDRVPSQQLGPPVVTSPSYDASQELCVWNIATGSKSSGYPYEDAGTRYPQEVKPTPSSNPIYDRLNDFLVSHNFHNLMYIYICVFVSII